MAFVRRFVMTEFIPSENFVEKTMTRIRMAEEKKGGLVKIQIFQIWVKYAGAAGVILVGVANIMRFLATIYAPVVCH